MECTDSFVMDGVVFKMPRTKPVPSPRTATIITMEMIKIYLYRKREILACLRILSEDNSIHFFWILFLVYFIKNLLEDIISDNDFEVNRPQINKKIEERTTRNMRKTFKGENRIRDDREQEFIVSYYVMEDIGDEVYGISVEKIQEGIDYIEVEEILKISDSIQLVGNIIEKLMKYQVTPVSLAESVDTIMTMEEQNDKTVL